MEYLIEPQGPVHLASGVAGHQVRGVMETEKDMFKDMMATKDGNCYYSAISVKDGKMTVEFYGVDLESGEGKVLYSWGIIK